MQQDHKRGGGISSVIYLSIDKVMHVYVNLFNLYPVKIRGSLKEHPKTSNEESRFYVY